MTAGEAVPLIADIADATPEWLSLALGATVDEAVAEPVGTGQIGTCFRVRLRGEAGLPPSVLIKLPAADPGARALLANPYRTEVRFYRELAPTLAVRVPHLHHGAMAPEGGDFVLVLADLAPAEQGDQIVGAPVAAVLDAAVNLAGLHGPRWCDPALLDVEGLQLNGPEDAALMAELFGPAVEQFVDALAPLLGDDDVATLRAVVPLLERWALAPGRSHRFAPVHGDYRLDNLLFPPGGEPGVVAVDWQTLSLGLPARDLAYLVATSLEPEQRRSAEREIVAAHHAALVGFGVADHPLDEAWDDYRFAQVQGPLVAVFGQAYGARSERGDRMFAAMTRRACAAIRDLATLDLVAAPSTLRGPSGP